MDKARGVLRRALEFLAFNSEGLMKDQAAEELLQDLDKADCLKPESILVLPPAELSTWLDLTLTPEEPTGVPEDQEPEKQAQESA